MEVATPRRNLIEIELNSIERNIQRRLGESPLATIGRRLTDVVAGVRASADAGSVTGAQVRGVIASISAMLDGLPDSFLIAALYSQSPTNGRAAKSSSPRWSFCGMRKSGDT